MTPDIREKAERLAARFLEYGDQDRNYPGLVALISQAIFEAHKAGREEMREEAAAWHDTQAVALRAAAEQVVKDGGWIDHTRRSRAEAHDRAATAIRRIL